MSTNGKDGVTITRLEIRNFQRIRAGVWDLAPGLQKLTSGGLNKQGKTSVLRAIRTLFEGAGAVPPVPVNTEADLSEDESVVRAWLSDGWTIRRSFTERGSYLHVIGPDGGKHGQTRVDAWTESAAFSPLTFFNLRPSEQAEVLLGLASDPELGAKLDANAARDAELREERRPHNSEIQRLRKVPEPEGERPPIDTSAEMKRMGELQKMERERGDKYREAQDALREVEASIRHADATAEAIDDLERRIEALQQELSDAERLLAKQQKYGDEKSAEVERLHDEHEALPDPSEEMEQVRARIEQADRVHEALEPWKEWERAQAAFAEHREAADELTAEINANTLARDELIASAEFPIPGLDFTPEGVVTLNELPLEQASGRERVELAVMAAVAANPRLRVILVDEGNDLDAEGLEHLADLADEHGLQPIVARLGLEGRGELEVVDGWGPLPEDDEEAEEEREEEAQAEALP